MKYIQYKLFCIPVIVIMLIVGSPVFAEPQKSPAAAQLKQVDITCNVPVIITKGTGSTVTFKTPVRNKKYSFGYGHSSNYSYTFLPVVSDDSIAVPCVLKESKDLKFNVKFCKTDVDITVMNADGLPVNDAKPEIWIDDKMFAQNAKKASFVMTCDKHKVTAKMTINGVEYSKNSIISLSTKTAAPTEMITLRTDTVRCGQKQVNCFEVLNSRDVECLSGECVCSDGRVMMEKDGKKGCFDVQNDSDCCGNDCKVCSHYACEVCRKGVCKQNCPANLTCGRGHCVDKATSFQYGQDRSAAKWQRHQKRMER